MSGTKVFWINYQCTVSTTHTLHGLVAFSLIAIRVDGFLSNPPSINVGVPQGSVIPAVLFILVINDLFYSTCSSIYSSTDDTYLRSSFSSDLRHLAYPNIALFRGISASLLSNDLTNIMKWGQ